MNAPEANRQISAGDLRRLILSIRLVAFDFDGVFTDNTVLVMEDGSEAVRCNRMDGLGLAVLRGYGIGTVIVSAETNPVVGVRARKLETDCIQGCEDKLAAMESLAETQGIGLGDVAFVGNDVNDLPCLKAVGLPITVCDAHPDIHPHVLFRTERPGGHGAVREVCDLFCRTIREHQESETPV